MQQNHASDDTVFCSVMGNRFPLDYCPYGYLCFCFKHQGFREAPLDLKAKFFPPLHSQITASNHYKLTMVLAKFNNHENLLSALRERWLLRGYEDGNEI